MFEFLPQQNTIKNYTNKLNTLENELSQYSNQLAEIHSAKTCDKASLSAWSLLRAFIAYDKEQKHQHNQFRQRSKQQNIHHWTIPYFKNALFDLAQTTSTQSVLIKQQLFVSVCMTHQTDSKLKASRMWLLTMIKSWIQQVEQRCDLERQLLNAFNSIHTTPYSQNDSG